jgi:hypothetical protein
MEATMLAKQLLPLSSDEAQVAAAEMLDDVVQDARRFRAMAAEWDAYVHNKKLYVEDPYRFQIWNALCGDRGEDDGDRMRSIIDSFLVNCLPIGATRQ